MERAPIDHHLIENISSEFIPVLAFVHRENKEHLYQFTTQLILRVVISQDPVSLTRFHGLKNMKRSQQNPPSSCAYNYQQTFSNHLIFDNLHLQHGHQGPRLYTILMFNKHLLRAYYVPQMAVKLLLLCHLDASV